MVRPIRFEIISQFPGFDIVLEIFVLVSGICDSSHSVPKPVVPATPSPKIVELAPRLPDNVDGPGFVAADGIPDPKLNGTDGIPATKTDGADGIPDTGIGVADGIPDPKFDGGDHAPEATEESSRLSDDASPVSDRPGEVVAD